MCGCSSRCRQQETAQRARCALTSVAVRSRKRLRPSHIMQPMKSAIAGRVVSITCKQCRSPHIAVRCSPKKALGRRPRFTWPRPGDPWRHCPMPPCLITPKESGRAYQAFLAALRVVLRATGLRAVFAFVERRAAPARFTLATAFTLRFAGAFLALVFTTVFAMGVFLLSCPIRQIGSDSGTSDIKTVVLRWLT